jgi:hypothetical protein
MSRTTHLYSELKQDIITCAVSPGMSLSETELGQRHRFPMALPVVLAQTDESQENAQTRDVSSGGVYFEVAEAPTPGSRMEFVLTLPVEITLTGPGVDSLCRQSGARGSCSGTGRRGGDH